MKVNMKKILLFISSLLYLLFNNCALQEPVEPRSAEITRGGPKTSAVPVIYYSEHGAKGDGKTCDFEALKRAHDAANISGAKVKADPGMTYYIGATTKTISIQTDTDWTGAKFILDDTTIEKRGNDWAHSWIFRIESFHKPFPVRTVSNLKKDQPKIPLNLGKKVILVAFDNTTRRYIRHGSNENPGAFQRDLFIVDKDGTVDPSAPILWDYNNISSLMAYHYDEHLLTVTGGHFTTIAHRGGNHIDPYMYRGIQITRSNVVIDGIYHDVVGEEAPMVAYLGFLNLLNCADVTIQNTMFSGRFVYGGKGTYDLQIVATINLKIINCGQTNEITDSTYWGVMASNYSKNILLDRVKFSRFDSHQGVYNTTILNSEFGWQGIQIIGSGTLLVENVATRSAAYITLRQDYGSTWEGNIYIKNGIHLLGGIGGRILDTRNNGTWNFGYQCYQPKFIYIDGFHAVNSGPSVVDVLTNTEMTVDNFPNQTHPYILTDTIYVRNFRADNGNALRFTHPVLSEPSLGNVKIERDNWPADLVWPGSY